MLDTHHPKTRIPSVRLSPDAAAVVQELGLLGELPGNWHGHGFNLIARPDKDGGGPLFLELNQTQETLKIDPIATSIPNRGFAQQDIELFGLTYLQKISDAVTGGALHIEPGIWVTQPATTQPPVSPPNNGQIVARMATIPHGNALLAQGSAIPVPQLTNGTFDFKPVNTSPFPFGAAMPAGGTPAFGPTLPLGGFVAYDLGNLTPAATNFRTPAGNIPEVPLPASIDGVPMQSVINDPTRLLQAAIKDQFIEKMVVIDIATAASLDPTGSLKVFDGGGGIANLPFLGPNADTALVFATFWIETIRHPFQNFLQIQYVQTVILNFPILGAPPPPPPAPPGPPNFSWPHVSVATLRKTFG